MSRWTPLRSCLANLPGDFPPGSFRHINRDEALARMRMVTGQDAGFDAQQWEHWIRENSR